VLKQGCQGISRSATVFGNDGSIAPAARAKMRLRVRDFYFGTPAASEREAFHGKLGLPVKLSFAARVI
jgi:hypothetical protein